MNTLHVKKNDVVQIISGNDKGKKGKVLEVSRKEGKIIVDGVHIITKHVKPRKMGEPGGLVKAEGAIYASKAMLVCPKCNKPTRVGYQIQADGKKLRRCKNAGCGELF